MTRRLALVAENALLNGDLQRARLALVDLQEANARGGPAPERGSRIAVTSGPGCVPADPR